MNLEKVGWGYLKIVCRLPLWQAFRREGRWGPLRICCRYGQNESLPYPALPLPLSRSKSEREKNKILDPRNFLVLILLTRSLPLAWRARGREHRLCWLIPTFLKSERERPPILLTYTHSPPPSFPLSRLKSEREPKSHPKRSAFGETWNLGLSAKGRKKVNGEKESSEGMNFDLG